MGCGSRRGVCTSSPSAKSALLATCSSNGFLSTKCLYITMRTPQSLRGGTILTSSTRVRSPLEPFNTVTMYLLKIIQEVEGNDEQTPSCETTAKRGVLPMSNRAFRKSEGTRRALSLLSKNH